jgi:DNA polymerase-3 subunit chi
LKIEFHTGIADIMDYSCRLLRKAHRRGTRAMVGGDPESLNQLDLLLWTFEPLEFVPHARLRHGDEPAGSLQRTPIWLVDTDMLARGQAQSNAPWPTAEVAVNLGDEPLAQPQRFARVIELVGQAPAQRQSGRARWRHYVGLGLQPVLSEGRRSESAA